MLTSVFGFSVKYEAWNYQDFLPVYIAGSYDFRTAYIGKKRCIMLAPTEELASLPALKKQIAKIQRLIMCQLCLSICSSIKIPKKKLYRK